MARARRKGRPLHGWLVIDKPAGMTSTDVVTRVRRRTEAQKVGHGGTLDPLATGVLPLAFGEATKTVAWLMAGRKRYRFTARWGEARATDDAEGEVIATSERRPAAAEIEAALAGFIGTIEQVPPRFAAVKVEGERAYDLARRGETVELAPRPIEVDSFALIERPGPRPCDLRGGVRARRLCPRADPRPRPAARLPRPRRRAAPPAGRAVSCRGRDLARGARAAGGR